MKLTKRRSSPYLPVSSTLWSPDSGHTSHTESTNLTPLGSRSTTSLIPQSSTTRISLQRRGQSIGPDILRNYGHETLGTDYAVEAQTQSRQTQTQAQKSSGSKNVLIPCVYDDHHRRSLHPRPISDLGAGMQDMVENENESENENGIRRTRDKTGQNRYPPNSLAPGNGWGFGRMRRSRKQESQIAMSAKEELERKGNALTSRSEPYLPSPPISPTPLTSPIDEVSASALPVSPTLPSSCHSPNVKDSVKSGPSAFTRHLSFIIDKPDGLDTEPLRSQSPSSLTRSASLSETVASGESSLALIDSLRRRTTSLVVPRFRKDSPTHRKLQKRRTGSYNPPTVESSPLQNHLHMQEVIARKEDLGAPSTSIMEGREISDMDNAWTLARNSSTSTTASSMLAPSTEESTVLTPPYRTIGDNRGSGDTWDGIDIPTVSRSSTLSYMCGEDNADLESKEINMMDMKQILLEGSDTPLGPILPCRPTAVRQQASFLSEDTVMPSPSTELELETAQTPSPASSTPRVDFTASPINHPASPAASPAGTVSSNLSPAGQRYTHFRSRASSVSMTGVSTYRASEYSITSIGEVGVANMGSMTPATIVHLTPVDPTSLSSNPTTRPGVHRSKSEIGHPLSRALAPFLSKESLRSTPNITIPGPSKPSRPKQVLDYRSPC